jgi:uncharacterized protein YjbI with pentapeptide repeats
MKNYIEQFNKIVHELREHPKISILCSNIFEPASSISIKTFEEKLGHKLDNDLKDFFLTTNGLALSWVFSQGDASKKMPSPLLGEQTGHISIPSIEQLSTSSTLTIDAFSPYNKVVLKDNAHGICSLSLSNYLDSIQCSFSDYFDFIIASKGYVKYRKLFFQPNSTLQNFKCNLSLTAIHHFFKQSDRQGASIAKLKTQAMQQQAASSKTISPTQLNTIVEAHHRFLSNGGAGGSWTACEVSGFVFGVYDGKSTKEGKQANFEQANLASESLDTCELQLPFTSFCGAHGKYQDFSNSDLSHCLFTDTNFEKAVFADANLSFSDFSRSNLREVSFMNANLENCDFENCDLTRADFRGANWKNAKFPGAILENVLY